MCYVSLARHMKDTPGGNSYSTSTSSVSIKLLPFSISVVPCCLVIHQTENYRNEAYAVKKNVQFQSVSLMIELVAENTCIYSMYCTFRVAIYYTSFGRVPNLMKENTTNSICVTFAVKKLYSKYNCALCA